jgi:hypothetical protein
MRSKASWYDAMSLLMKCPVQFGALRVITPSLYPGATVNRARRGGRFHHPDLRQKAPA